MGIKLMHSNEFKLFRDVLWGSSHRQTAETELFVFSKQWHSFPREIFGKEIFFLLLNYLENLSSPQLLLLRANDTFGHEQLYSLSSYTLHWTAGCYLCR